MSKLKEKFLKIAKSRTATILASVLATAGAMKAFEKNNDSDSFAAFRDVVGEISRVDMVGDKGSLKVYLDEELSYISANLYDGTTVETAITDHDKDSSVVSQVTDSNGKVKVVYQGDKNGTVNQTMDESGEIIETIRNGKVVSNDSVKVDQKAVEAQLNLAKVALGVPLIHGNGDVDIKAGGIGGPVDSLGNPSPGAGNASQKIKERIGLQPRQLGVSARGLNPKDLTSDR